MANGSANTTCSVYTEVTYVITEMTPFHPVSHIWPDHPADKGTLTAMGTGYEVMDCQVGAVELASGELHLSLIHI